MRSAANRVWTKWDKAIPSYSCASIVKITAGGWLALLYVSNLSCCCFGILLNDINQIQLNKQLESSIWDLVQIIPKANARKPKHSLLFATYRHLKDSSLTLLLISSMLWKSPEDVFPSSTNHKGSSLNIYWRGRK